MQIILVEILWMDWSKSLYISILGTKLQKNILFSLNCLQKSCNLHTTYMKMKSQRNMSRGYIINNFSALMLSDVR